MPTPWSSCESWWHHTEFVHVADYRFFIALTVTPCKQPKWHSYRCQGISSINLDVPVQGFSRSTLNNCLARIGIIITLATPSVERGTCTAANKFTMLQNYRSNNSQSKAIEEHIASLTVQIWTKREPINSKLLAQTFRIIFLVRHCRPTMPCEPAGHGHPSVVSRIWSVVSQMQT